MPLYDYVCDCGKEREDVCLKISEIDTPVVCECGESMRRTIPRNQGKPVIYEYYSENLGTQITSPKQKKAVMEARGVQPRC